MGKAPLAIFVAVLAVTGLMTLSYLTEAREVIVSTPSDYTGETVPLTLPPNGQACADEILFDTDADLARFGATARRGEKAPELEVIAEAYPKGRTEFRSDYRATARVPGGWSGERQLDVPLRPPAQDTFGTFCVRNLSDREFDLVGSDAGRAFSRPSVTVDGQPIGVDLQLRLMESGRHSLLSRVGQLTAHASSLKPFGAWWIWVLALALLVLAPLAVAGAIRSALATDETPH